MFFIEKIVDRPVFNSIKFFKLGGQPYNNTWSDTMQKSLSFVSIFLIVLFFLISANAQEEGGGAYYDFGVFAYEDGDYKGAEKNLLKALEVAPHNPSFNHFLVIILVFLWMDSFS